MPVRNVFAVCKVLLALSVLLLLAGSAGAYVGPGAGLDLLPYAVSLAAWVLTAFSAVLLWPLYALIRRIRGGKRAAAPSTEPATREASADSPTSP